MNEETFRRAQDIMTWRHYLKVKASEFHSHSDTIESDADLEEFAIFVRGKGRSAVMKVDLSIEAKKKILRQMRADIEVRLNELLSEFSALQRHD